MSFSLLRASLAASTRKAYARYWERFLEFCSHNFKTCFFPASSLMITEFIAYLHTQGYSPSTISSHLSAVVFFHKLSGYSDPCQNFVTQRVLLGCKKSSHTSDMRRPILLADLHRMVKACSELFTLYECCLSSGIPCFF